MTSPRQSSLPTAEEAKVQDFMHRLRKHAKREAAENPELGYVEVIEAALLERLRVNVGLMMEIDELKRQR